MKKNCSKKGFFNNCKDWLSSKYKEPKQKINWSLLVVLSVPILIFMGFLYLVAFLSKFNISYDWIYFNTKDCIDVLYKKGGIYFYTANLYLFLSIPIVFYVININSRDKKNKKHILIENIVFSLLFFVYLYGLRDVEKGLDCFIMIIFSLYVFFILLLWRFYNIKHIVIISIVGVLTIILYKIGEKDAEEIKTRKVTFDIILKNNDTILKEGDTNRYFIYKTTDYLFIMDETEKDRKKVIIKPVSDIETTSFEAKKN